MSLLTKLFTRLVIAAGIVVLIVHLVEFGADDPARFACYLLLAAIASSVPIHVSGLGAGISLSFVVVLLAMLDLSPAEAVLISASSGLANYLATERWRALTSEAFFRVATATIAVYWSNSIGHKVASSLPGSRLPVNLGAAAIAFVLLSVLPAALNAVLRDRLPIGRTLRRYLRGIPIVSAGAALAGVVHAASAYIGWQMALLMLPIFYLFYRSYCLFLARLESEKKLVEETASLNLRTIEALALAVEAKDQTTGDHLQRVQVYALEVGKELGLDDTELKALQAASLLHDIGKLAVPEHIISKPGKLTPEEFDKMKIHPVVGAEILERVRFPYPVVPMVRSHHEKWDGSGYPDGLQGEDIPIGARILAAVDCLDALASDRQYRRALPLDKAMEVIHRESGKSFDPQVVEVLGRRYVELEQLAKSKPLDDFKLSTDIKINNGLAPAAGFADARTYSVTSAAGPADLSPTELMAAVRREVHDVLDPALARKGVALTEAMAAFSTRLQSLVPHDTFVLFLQQRDRLVSHLATGENQWLFRTLEVPMGQGLSGWALESKKAILNGNPATEVAHLRDPKRVPALKSALVVPLEASTQVLGTLSLYHSGREAFTKHQLRAMMAVSSQIAAAVESWLGTTECEDAVHLPVHEATGLFERLELELVRYQTDGTPMTVVLCELDGYNQLTRQLLPSECEAIVQTAAQALRNNCRETDFVAYMGGQEFALLLPSLRGETAEIRVRQMRESVSQAVRHLGIRQHLELLTATAQVPEEGVDPEFLLAQLDRKLQRARVAPKHPARRAPEADESVHETLRLRWRTTVV